MGKKQSIKGQGGEEDNLEDEEAVLRMFKRIEDQNRGELRERLKNVGYENILNAKQFRTLVTGELKMKENDLTKLLRVSTFSKQPSKDARLKVEVVAKALEDRVANSEKLKGDCLRELAKKFKEKGHTDI